ncbi:flagellar hook-length control protein FliK [Pseudoalteromonas shioyasakiensis]|uniref:flagellar hook-length control protein FliK n=1 Tax=Pseudoalteromonas shioyasakiensis TaxID=1190813 RepID=UPI00211936C3|nr:flagellar hook-length control protein FliK [Pseudoalteromonas shioyasakiensis]MCQ8877502.1 flagellar hook-length control protein FliK [Pseudoalteromonas shioyasakiensis]
MVMQLRSDYQVVSTPTTAGNIKSNSVSSNFHDPTESLIDEEQQSKANQGYKESNSASENQEFADFTLSEIVAGDEGEILNSIISESSENRHDESIPLVQSMYLADMQQYTNELRNGGKATVVELTSAAEISEVDIDHSDMAKLAKSPLNQSTAAEMVLIDKESAASDLATSQVEALLKTQAENLNQLGSQPSVEPLLKSQFENPDQLGNQPSVEALLKNQAENPNQLGNQLPVEALLKSQVENLYQLGNQSLVAHASAMSDKTHFTAASLIARYNRLSSGLANEYLTERFMFQQGPSNKEPTAEKSAFNALNLDAKSQTVNDFEFLKAATQLHGLNTDNKESAHSKPNTTLFNQIDSQVSSLQWRKEQLNGSTEQWGQRLLHVLSDKVNLQIGQHIQRAQIRLDPPQLGSIEISISVEGDKTSVQLVASNAQVREAMQQTLDQLRQSLSQDGQMSVNVDISDQQKQSNESQDNTDTQITDNHLIEEVETPSAAKPLSESGWLDRLV